MDQLFHLVTQIAAGVEALAERYAVIHRDLACRNCLVHYAGARGPRVVISDFGMAKRVRRNQRYTDKQYRALVPLRWMAPESALAGVYSRASDVYSLGVVLWEVFASGRRPYDSLAGAEVYDALTRGRTLQCENNWPLRFRSLLGRMWAPQPGGRPPARDVHAELRLMAQDLASTTDRKGGRAHEAVAHVSIL